MAAAILASMCDLSHVGFDLSFALFLRLFGPPSESSNGNFFKDFPVSGLVGVLAKIFAFQYYEFPVFGGLGFLVFVTFVRSPVRDLQW